MTISPGSTARTYSAPTMSRPPVSDDRHQHDAASASFHIRARRREEGRAGLHPAPVAGGKGRGVGGGAGPAEGGGGPVTGGGAIRRGFLEMQALPGSPRRPPRRFLAPVLEREEPESGNGRG